MAKVRKVLTYLFDTDNQDDLNYKNRVFLFSLPREVIK